VVPDQQRSIALRFMLRCIRDDRRFFDTVILYRFYTHQLCHPARGAARSAAPQMRDPPLFIAYAVVIPDQQRSIALRFMLRCIRDDRRFSFFLEEVYHGPIGQAHGCA
jgi:hypothetical protein